VSYIPDELRAAVIARADNCCEYCLYPLDEDFVQPEIDHIIPVKHLGPTTEDNLCLSCLHCNRHKGTDFGSFDPETKEMAFFFHPRRDKWTIHFRLDGALIVPLTPQGRVTEFILTFNDAATVRERNRLIRLGRYPRKPPST